MIIIEVSSGTSRNTPSICRVSLNLSIKIAKVLSQYRKDCFSIQDRRVTGKGWKIRKTVGYLKWLPPVWSVYPEEKVDQRYLVEKVTTSD